MNLREPVRKRVGYHIKPLQPFPILIESENDSSYGSDIWPIIIGNFTGDSVVVCNPEDMISLYGMGFFGKGSFSRGYPSFDQSKKGIPPIIKERQWKRRKSWMDKIEKLFSYSQTQDKSNKTNPKLEKDKIEDGDKCEQNEDTETINTSMKVEETKTTSTGVEEIRTSMGVEEIRTSTEEEDIRMSMEVEEIRTSTEVEEIRTTSTELEEVRTTSTEVEDTKITSTEVEEIRTASTEIEEIKTTSTEVEEAQTTSTEVEEVRTTSMELEEISTTSTELEEVRTTPTEVEDTKITSTEVEEIRTATTEIEEIKTTSTEVEEAWTTSTEVEEVQTTSMELEDIRTTSTEAKEVSTTLMEVEENNSECPEPSPTEKPKTACTRRTSSHNSFQNSMSNEIETHQLKCSLNNSGTTGVNNTVLVLADSDHEDIEKVIRNPQPHLEDEPIRTVSETLNLTLEEAFFLSYALGCLHVIDMFGNPMSLEQLWITFCQVKPSFIELYVAYHHFRAKGWVVKSGYKFGGDFLLYKQGPAFYHASSVVLVEKVNSQLEKAKNTLTWTSFHGLNRLAESSGKDIITCQVLFPDSLTVEDLMTPKSLPKFQVNELLTKRWISSLERQENEA